MRVCVRLDSDECSVSFPVEEAVREGCLLAPLVFNIFIVSVIYMTLTRFETDKDVMDVFMSLRNKIGAGGRGVATGEDSALATSTWGILQADDTAVVSESPEQLRKIMVVIVTASERLA